MCFTFGLRHLKIQPKPSMSEIRNYLVANPIFIYFIISNISNIDISRKRRKKKKEKEENDKRNEGRNGSVGSRATCDKERERAAN